MLPKPSAETSTRFVGFCAICEEDHKLFDRDSGHVLVHHGYKRPGHGYIVGDCMSVYREPYETSCDVLKEYLSVLQSQRKSLVANIERWETNPPHYFEEKGRSWRRRDEDEKDCYSRFVTCEYIFDRKVRENVDSMKWQLTGLDREIARIEGWINKWEPKPVRTVEEEIRRQEEKAAERKARLDAAKKARQDKRDAIDAKHAALKAKREGIKLEIAATAKKLAAEKPGKDADPKVRAAHSKAVEKLRREMKKASNWMYYEISKMGIDDALLEIGIAYQSRGYIEYSLH